MPDKKKQNYDFFDEYFDKLANDDSNIINVTISEFGKEIRKSVDDSVKNKGYDSFSDMINFNLNAENKKRVSKPYVAPNKFDASSRSRYGYFINSLDNVVYENSYRGYYREGHQKAIDIYKERARFCENDLSDLEVSVADEIRRMRNTNGRKSSDRFEAGYLDGLQFVKKALKRSALYMMNIIKDEVYEIKRK